MSWSFQAIGTALAVLAAIDAYASQLTGRSKQEFEAAAPHLKGLVAQNTETSPAKAAVKITASGHGYWLDDVCKSNTCAVSIERVHGLVEEPRVTAAPLDNSDTQVTTPVPAPGAAPSDIPSDEGGARPQTPPPAVPVRV